MPTNSSWGAVASHWKLFVMLICPCALNYSIKTVVIQNIILIWVVEVGSNVIKHFIYIKKK